MPNGRLNLALKLTRYAALRAQSHLVVGNMIDTLKQVNIAVVVVVRLYLAVSLNLMLVVAGQVSTSLWQLMWWWKNWIPVWVCIVLKFNVTVVLLTWGMCFLMVLFPQGCVIASIPWH
jgi:hypothetical protein